MSICMLWFVLMLMRAFETSSALQCEVWGEPHILTWTKGSYLCTAPGPHVIMDNPWIQHRINVFGGYAVESIIDFRDGISSVSICNIRSFANSSTTMTLRSLCESKGISISQNQNKSLETITIYYATAGITIVYSHDLMVSRPHFTISIWKPDGQNSTGLCAQSKCVSSSRSMTSPPLFKMSTESAKKICQNYINGYLQKLSSTSVLHNAKYNSSINMISDACIYDVAITGNSDAANSALEMLMIEELTSTATNMKSVAAQFQNGIQKASQTYNEVKAASAANVARMLRF